MDETKTTKTTKGMDPERRERFEADLAEIRVRTGGAANEPHMILLGLVLMGVGAAVALISFVASQGMDDTRNILSSLIMTGFAICLTLIGAVLFLRHSLARFLRAWLLRLIYEQQAPQ